MAPRDKNGDGVGRHLTVSIPGGKREPKAEGIGYKQQLRDGECKACVLKDKEPNVTVTNYVKGRRPIKSVGSIVLKTANMISVYQKLDHATPLL